MNYFVSNISCIHKICPSIIMFQVVKGVKLLVLNKDFLGGVLVEGFFFSPFLLSIF